ncbi:hypothetical protein PPTG_22588 [Phytophthora nicotianae INRA-310]|uniref:Uncharacterized protein n=1 Tax=Phytophthora nicotianae (strain INRA-310) TaxID=761204 RepID=W2QGR8_PHYN3|nr:hypothetical protein PPTG_22588 [Phytophthora nicotianae INRA-310]ETN11475.1 hypothetical protein PPTG_22588 [Phytophthora nicotianae INRA-310]
MVPPTRYTRSLRPNALSRNVPLARVTSMRICRPSTAPPTTSRSFATSLAVRHTLSNR